MEFPQNPNYTHFTAPEDPSELKVSDYLIEDESFMHNPLLEIMASSSKNMTDPVAKKSSLRGVTADGKAEKSRRIAFRTQSENDNMDDGYRWRKYGKKSVKNSPHLRNYYKCVNGGCQVKKRVERDRDDPSYVITTYDEVHNHRSFGSRDSFSDNTPLMFPTSSSSPSL